MLSDLGDFEEYMRVQVKEWNAPGIGVSIVKDQEVIFSRGYGHRDLEKRMPFLSSTLFPIASNTKLFTTVAAGILVERGKLGFDQPIRDFVPSLRFHDRSLDETVTLRDMLGHRTGVPRYDMISHGSMLSKKELFDRIRFMKPIAPLRSRCIYNNNMYQAVAHIIELLGGKSWEEFTRDEILAPLGMSHTCFAISDMREQPDHAAPVTERRDSEELWQVPYPDLKMPNAAGSMVSNLEDMSRWLAVLMNNGVMAGEKVIPERVLEATLKPGLAFPDLLDELVGCHLRINPTYGLGRLTAAYRGNLLVSHGGDLRAFHSQVSYLPREKIGVVAFVIGDHCAMLADAIGYNIYDRLLGMPDAGWMEAVRNFQLKGKQNMRAARARVTPDAVPDTQPSHALEDYAGCYTHQAYGPLRILLESSRLQLDFRESAWPLHHYHYDRFDSDDDEEKGSWSLSFLTSPLGEIDRINVWLDGTDVVFTRIPDAPALAVLTRLVGRYAGADDEKCNVRLREDGQLTLQFLHELPVVLIPFKGLQFRNPKWPRRKFEFMMEGGRVTKLRHWNAIAEFVLDRVEEVDGVDRVGNERSLSGENGARV